MCSELAVWSSSRWMTGKHEQKVHLVGSNRRWRWRNCHRPFTFYNIIYQSLPMSWKIQGKLEIYKKSRIRDKLYVKQEVIQVVKLNGRDQISNACVLITIHIFFLFFIVGINLPFSKMIFLLCEYWFQVTKEHWLNESSKHKKYKECSQRLFNQKHCSD